MYIYVEEMYLFLRERESGQKRKIERKRNNKNRK